MEIVAEFTYNHLGKATRARQMIYAAKEAGASCVKFELRNNDSYFRNYPSIKKRKLQFEFSDEILSEFVADCRQANMPWFASVHDIHSMKKILPFRPKYIKVASREARIVPFLNRIKDLNAGKLPIVISTGGLLFKQIEEIYDLMAGENLTLVHTSCLYPCDAGNMNMNRIRMMKDKFKCSIGYSGHEEGFLPSLFAVGLDVTYIERHFTLEENVKKVVKGLDHFNDELCTLGPRAFRQMVNGISLFLKLNEQKKDDDSLEAELKRVNAYGIPGWDGQDVYIR